MWAFSLRNDNVILPLLGNTAYIEKQIPSLAGFYFIFSFRKIISKPLFILRSLLSTFCTKPDNLLWDLFSYIKLPSTKHALKLYPIKEKERKS